MPKISKDSDVNFANNDIQFPRLISEIADVVMSPADYQELAASMDLTVHELHELFARAQNIWDEIKART